MIGHAVFDLDGTLVDSAPHIASILNAMLSERGVTRRVSEADTRPRVAAGGRAMVEAVLGEACGDAAASLDEFRKRYASAPTPRESLYGGVEQALSALKKAGIGLAVWSNKPQALCEKVLSELGISPLFDAVVGTGPSVPHKPDPTGFDRALAIAGGCRARSCFVGDSELDFLAAAAIGVPAVMVTYGYGEAEADWPGAIRVDAFSQVLAVVERLLGARAPG